MRLLEKFIDMDGIIIDGILLPKELIIDDYKLVGYTMDYFKDLNTKVPYLDEIICDEDHFVIDRDKQISSQKRLAKDYSIF